MSTPKFVTSDLHFRHKKIIEYCNRPWSTVEEMNEGLIQRWNSVVKKDDSIILVGDAAMVSSKHGRGEATDMLLRLNGKKTLVRGNHDSHLEIFVDSGFNVVDYIFVNNILIIHHPPQDSKKTCDLVNRLKPGLIVHGHQHSDLGGSRLFNVCVDIHNWTPVSWSVVEQKFELNKNEPQLFEEA